MKTRNGAAFPSVAEVAACVSAAVSAFHAHNRQSPGLPIIRDQIDSLDITVAADGKGGYAYQTGDNSFMGSCYHYPFWGVSSVSGGVNVREIAVEIREQILEIASQ